MKNRQDLKICHWVQNSTRMLRWTLSSGLAVNWHTKRQIRLLSRDL